MTKYELDTTSPEAFLDSIYNFCVKYKDELVVDEMFYNCKYDIKPTLEMAKMYPFLNTRFRIFQCLEAHKNWMEVYATINVKEVFAIVYLYESINNGGCGPSPDKLVRVLGWTVQKSDALKWVDKLKKISDSYIPERIAEYADTKEGAPFRMVRYHDLSEEKTNDMLKELATCLNIDCECIKQLLSFNGDCVFDTPLQFRVFRMIVVDTIPHPDRLDEPDAESMKYELSPIPTKRILHCIYESYDHWDTDYYKPLVFFYNEQETQDWIKVYKQQEEDYKYRQMIVSSVMELEL